MKYPLYCVRDVKVSFFPPQPATTEEEAIRNFSMMVNNPSGVMGFAPKDFDLYMVGYFDSVKGTVEACDPIEFVVDGTSCVGDDHEK